MEVRLEGEGLHDLRGDESLRDVTWFLIMCGGLIATQAALTDIYLYWYDPFSWNVITDGLVLVLIVSIPALLGGASSAATMLADVAALTYVVVLCIGALLTPHESLNAFRIILTLFMVSGLSIQISGWVLRNFGFSKEMRV